MAALQPTPNIAALTATLFSMILEKLTGMAYVCLFHMELPGLDSAGPSGSKVAVHLHVSALGAGWAPLLNVLSNKVARPFSMVVQGSTGTKRKLSEGLGLKLAQHHFYCTAQSQTEGQPKGKQALPLARSFLCRQVWEEWVVIFANQYIRTMPMAMLGAGAPRRNGFYVNM